MEPAEALLRAATWLKRLRMPGVAPAPPGAAGWV
jgi:hypothetical protein